MLTYPGWSRCRFLVREHSATPVASSTHQTGLGRVLPARVVLELNRSPKCALRWRRVRCGWLLATAAPQTRGEHPAPQCFARTSRRGPEMFRRQRRPEALVPLARIVLTNSRTCWRRDRSVRSTADVTHQSLGPARTVTLLQTLHALTAARRLRQLVSLGSALRQLLGTHPCPSHSRLLLRLRVGDISIGRSRGHYHWVSTQAFAAGADRGGETRAALEPATARRP